MYHHIIHPELHLELSTPVLVVWTTLVAGLTGAGWHFLGWSLLLLGSAGWTTQRFPRLLSVCYLLAGVVSLFFYLLGSEELGAVPFVMVLSSWQGIVLWQAAPDENQASDSNEEISTL